MVSGNTESGPIPVTVKVAGACKVGWDVVGVLALSNIGMAIGRGLEYFAVGVGSDEKGNTRHMAKKRSPAGADQPRPSKALCACVRTSGWKRRVGRHT